ncbi:hypothetical protein NESM_000523300 [Novymonas esmeraldas]|uniref:Uncharacterized protein n=1 Tax=Novymonas esmeraldas TaxID=1808958 RepID=A0AAW0EQU9_9TRYP
MHLRGTSQVRPLNSSSVAPERAGPTRLDGGRGRPRHSEAARWSDMFVVGAVVPPPGRLTNQAMAVEHRARLVHHRSRDAVVADLQRIRAEANMLVLQRWFWRWGLCAVRSAALRRIQRRARLVLWQRVGSRCFAWWCLVTERRLCREALYREAAAQERAVLLDGLCRVAWDRWRQWVTMRVGRRAAAMRLGLVSLQRHARLRLCDWVRHMRRCAQLRSLEQIGYAADRSLARWTLLRWRQHTLEGYLVFPLQVRAAQRVAMTAFHTWQRRACAAARLRRTSQVALLRVALRCFDQWKRWLRRRLQAALLQQANDARLLRRLFSQWAWPHQLHALAYERCVSGASLPHPAA